MFSFFQIAQQEAERAKFVVEKAVQDKIQTVIKAEGEARSAKMLSDTIRDQPEFLDLRKIEAAREIAKTISSSNNTVYLNADNLLFNLTSGVVGSSHSSPQSTSGINVRKTSNSQDNGFFDELLNPVVIEETKL